MSDDEVVTTLQKVCDYCDSAMKSYESVSFRYVLIRVGLSDRRKQNELIRYVAMNGFDYCLDPIIASTHFDPNNPKAVDGMVTDHPSERGCWWGPDQLKSRVQCVRLPQGGFIR